MPEEQTFSIKNNPYNKVAYNRLCSEFNLSNNKDLRGVNGTLADFRWKGGRNRGLGDIFIDYGEGYKPSGKAGTVGKGGGIPKCACCKKL